MLRWHSKRSSIANGHRNPSVPSPRGWPGRGCCSASWCSSCSQRLPPARYLKWHMHGHHKRPADCCSWLQCAVRFKGAISSSQAFYEEASCGSQVFVMWQACLNGSMEPGVQVFQLGADGSLMQSASGLCVTPVNYSEPCGGQHIAKIWPECTLVPCRLLRSSLHRHQRHPEHREQRAQSLWTATPADY